MNKITKIIAIAMILPFFFMGFYIFVWQWHYLEIRDTLFTDNLNESASRELVRSDPSLNLLAGIEKDYAVAREISDNVYGAKEISKIENLPTIQKIPLLVKLNYGIGGAGYGTVADIETRAKIMKYNLVYGCCSDFSEVFTLVSIATKTVIREVVTDAHTFSEAWLPEFREWVFVDSQFGLMARSKTSRSGFASVEELRIQILNDSHDIVYLGKDSDAIYINKSISRYYLKRDYWGNVRYLDSMEVVSQSILLSKLQLHAKAISYFIGYLIGVIPRFNKVSWPAENSI